MLAAQMDKAFLADDTYYTDGYMETEHGLIHYLAEPKGQETATIIFIHGAFVNCETMRPLASHFSGYQRILFDLPAHGKSTGNCKTSVKDYAKAAETFIHKLLEADAIHNKIILVGWSMGGSISMLLALKNTLPIKTIVLLSSAPMWVFPKIPREQFDLTAIFGTAFTASSDPDVKEQILGNMSLYSSSVDTCETDIDAIGDYNICSEIADIKAHAIIISGKADNVAPVEMQQLMAQTIKGADIKLYDDRGHLLLMELHESVADTIKEFLG